MRQGFELESVQDAARGEPTFRRIGGVARLSDAFARLVAHPRVLDLLHALLGARVELWRDLLMMKPARVGREKPWHQDAVYWPWRPMSIVSAATAIDACTPRNGCLQVVPRSHRAALRHRGRERWVALNWRQRLRARYVPLEAGDVLVFHSLLLHASRANRSDRDRRICINSYKSPELEFIGPPETWRDSPLVSARET